MRGPRWSILIFAAGVLLVFGALGWVTHQALRLEQAEQDARADARHQENIRLALWRMDSTIGPILAREAARPYFEYRPFYPADRAYTRQLGRVEPGEVFVPSPLLHATDPFVRLHFERSASGEVTSPQVPTGEMRALAESVYVTGYALALSEQTLSQLTTLLAPARTATRDDAADELKKEANSAADLAAKDARSNEPPRQQAQKLEIEQSASEYQVRARNIGQINRPERAQTASAPEAAPQTRQSARGDAAPPAAATPLAGARDDAAREHDADAGQAGGYAYEPITVGPSDAGVVQREFIPSWVGDTPSLELVYTRQIDAGEARFEQGFWVNWPALRETLTASVQDLLPGAVLRPLAAVPAPEDLATLGRSLASLPAELVAPEPAALSIRGITPVRSTLLATWLAAIGAVIAIALVLRASLELAERRGRFVSAVTHELRTPLTTFCLYSQMLADGMVPTEEARRGYFKTLSSESQRLARIVESVLDYARLGRPRAASAVQPISAAALLEKLTPPLQSRCDQAGMTLVIDNTAPADTTLRCDPAQVERILYNLVDNACKYAAEAEDRRIHLTIAAARADLTLTVRDHGPGIPRAEAARIFRPFIRGKKQIDGSTPGLGVGLALAHGLAKECRGDLRLVPSENGAEFRLRLPLGD